MRGFGSGNRRNITRDEPTLLKEIIDLYLVELDYTLDELCEAICISTSDFLSFYPGLFSAGKAIRKVK